MKTTRQTIKGYKINYATNTISLNYKFAKLAQDIGSAECKRLIEIKEAFPSMTIVVEAGRKIDTTKQKKRLTYSNIAKHISAYSNADELLENFNLAIETSKPLASPYKYVCDWFYAQFPEYRKPMETVKNARTGIKLVPLPDESLYTHKEAVAVS